MKKLVGYTLVVNLAWILLMSKLSQKQELRQKLTPKQILQASLMQLNLPLLEQRILHELEINPALEMIELIDEELDDKIQDSDDSEEEMETDTEEDVELANAKASEVGLRFKRATDEFQSGLGKYTAEIQGYAQEVAAEVSEQGQKVQTEGAKYQWLQDRAASLQAEYIAAFGTPQAQPQQQRGR